MSSTDVLRDEIPELRVELILWHHQRQTRRMPYSASAYLIAPGRKPHEMIAGGSCNEAENESQAAREALRELQEQLGRVVGAAMATDLHDEVVRAALADPLAAVTERRSVA